MKARTLAMLDRRVPEMAERAFAAANRRAIKSGLPVVFVEGDGLYRLNPDGSRELLKTLPPRVKVESRVEQAKS